MNKDRVVKRKWWLMEKHVDAGEIVGVIQCAGGTAHNQVVGRHSVPCINSFLKASLLLLCKLVNL